MLEISSDVSPKPRLFDSVSYGYENEIPHLMRVNLITVMLHLQEDGKNAKEIFR